MDYYHKYLKYKNKYLGLKKLIAGGKSESQEALEQEQKTMEEQINKFKSNLNNYKITSKSSDKLIKEYNNLINAQIANPTTGIEQIKIIKKMIALNKYTELTKNLNSLQNMYSSRRYLINNRNYLELVNVFNKIKKQISPISF
jgi:hypothetical protein